MNESVYEREPPGKMLLQKGVNRHATSNLLPGKSRASFFLISRRTIHFLLQLEPILAIQFSMAHLLAMPKVEAGDGWDDADSS